MEHKITIWKDVLVPIFCSFLALFSIGLNMWWGHRTTTLERQVKGKQESTEENLEVIEIAKVFLTKQKEHEAFRRIVMDNVDKQQREKGRADNMSPDEILAQRWRWYWERPKSRCDLQMATDGREEEGESVS